MEALNYNSLKTSCAIAKERGETFYRFEDSEYASGAYFDNYRENDKDYSINQIVLDALGNIPIITAKMWQDLEKDVKQYGLYHSYRLAIAP